VGHAIIRVLGCTHHATHRLGSTRRGATLPNGTIGPSTAPSRMPFWTNPVGTNGRAREETADREDYRTAQSHATSQLQYLSSLSKQHSQAQSSSQYSAGLFSLTSSTTPASSWGNSLAQSTSPSSPSSSTDVNGVPKLSDAEIDRARINAMNGLVETLQKNVRVRYAMDITELVKTYVLSHVVVNHTNFGIAWLPH
jgi:hypothetical protein